MGIGLGDGLGLGAAVRDHDEPVSSLKNKAKKLWELICSGMKDIAYAMASPEEKNAMDLEEWTEKFVQDFFLKIPGETDPVFAKINEKTIQVGDILIQTHLESSRWLFVTIGGEQFRINRWQYDNANPKAKPFLPKDHVSIAFPNDSISIEGDVSGNLLSIRAKWAGMPVIHPNETHPTDVYSMSKKYTLLNTPTVKVGGTFGTMMDQSERVVAIVVEALEEIRKGNYTESAPSADKF